MTIENVQLTDLVVRHDAPLRDCLMIIDKHDVDSVIVTDHRGRLVGVLDETRIRKALLGGAELSDPVGDQSREAMTTVPPTCSRPAALDVMRALGLGVLPIVDTDGRVLGAHVDERVVGVGRRENWAVVMAGGRGRRLSPLSDDTPKPMLTVAGRPILERIVLHLVGSGIETIYISVAYLAEAIEDHFGDGAAFGARISYLRETTEFPLGTGGPLGLLGQCVAQPAAPVLVMNGDLVTAFDVGEMLDAHSDSGAVATIATSQYQHQVPFGVLEARDEDHLERIVEKPTSSWPINAGIYVLEPYLLRRVPPRTNYPITELFSECLRRGEPVGLWSMRSDWQDIGRPDELARARGHG
ncbi:sugar phosphate nucleotidyltransferase [Phytoactinopolyspora limicola]|uniref:sugar phosphate nucleotidyltransferase n=1 Tax=Phytoactinopolyspora limicola TaxID=2715536 RepID=UPI00140CD7F6|nr:sugar phosphate nucleotidyltransferase [Phytoactinopolyspora limicola]